MIAAVLRNGTCTGSLYKSSPEQQRTHEFCVLLGITLWSYSDFWAYSKGDAPTSMINIVGASSWNPIQTILSGNKGRANSSTSSMFSDDASNQLTKSCDFLILTYSGMQLRCSAPSPNDKDKWLAALHEGLEGNISENRIESLLSLTRRQGTSFTSMPNEDDALATKSEMLVQSAITQSLASFENEGKIYPMRKPLPRVKSAPKWTPAVNKHRTGYHSPCSDRSSPASEFQCMSCGCFPPEAAMRIESTPLPQYGLEERADNCHDCFVAQGVLNHVNYLCMLYDAEARDRAAIRTAREEVRGTKERLIWENAGLHAEPPKEDPPGIKADCSDEDAETVATAPAEEPKCVLTGLADALVALVSGKKFASYRQRSAGLDGMCQSLEDNGTKYVVDFMEQLDECAQSAESSGFYDSGSVSSKEKVDGIEGMRKQFQVAGDTSAALRLLYEYALPQNNQSVHNDSTMLATILEFFVDLCESGQIGALAFFWPQICHIHMQMLPPTDTKQLIRVEMIEDFLLTVATRYSVNLALSLSWGLTADLEESLGEAHCHPAARRRRFAVLRFVSELESVLFDFDGGWGGGGASGIMSPGRHQAALLRDAMASLQLRRRFSSTFLTRSVRMDKLKAEALEALGNGNDQSSASLTIARNASYFSSHMKLTRKLGDIAEKLRHLEVEKRKEVLTEELIKVNASGRTLGGDPLNRLCDSRFKRTVRIPVNETHVFRSKERTPVLLLMEIVADKTNENAEANVDDEAPSLDCERERCNSGVISSQSSQEVQCSSGLEISALGSLIRRSSKDFESVHQLSNYEKNGGKRVPPVSLLPADIQFQRDVLFAIMERGMSGSHNIIAKGAASAARRAAQAMESKRALVLINESAVSAARSDKGMTNSSATNSSSYRNLESNAQLDDDEVMEALRLLIIQSHVAKGSLSNGTDLGVKAEVGTDGGSVSVKAEVGTDGGSVDAGKVDSRLAGCGEISSSVLSALRLWKGGIVSNVELLELVQKDLQFIKHSAVFGSSDELKLIEDSAFWGRFSFGERWAEKKARLAASSPHGVEPGWDLCGCIVKSNDDLRQEAFVMQLIELCDETFRAAGLDLWVHPYCIVATGRSTGIIECVRNAMSFDSLKKRPGYGDGLAGHFKRMTEIAADPNRALVEAKQNFVRSLAAYSLMSYLFLFKDRHNGNLLLDTAGHVIHIDFGFVFGTAPGGSFSLEQSTPFKLTEEMLEVLDGIGSPLFSEFVTSFCCGFLALQAQADSFLTIVEITCRDSNFPCFEGKDCIEIVTKLRERLCPQLNKSQTVAYALDLIKFATTSYGTKQYDYFQYLSQGIAA